MPIFCFYKCQILFFPLCKYGIFFFLLFHFIKKKGFIFLSPVTNKHLQIPFGDIVSMVYFRYLSDMFIYLYSINIYQFCCWGIFRYGCHFLQNVVFRVIMELTHRVSTNFNAKHWCTCFSFFSSRNPLTIYQALISCNCICI